MRKRLVIVSSRHHPSQGGIGAAVWHSAHALSESNWDVVLVTRPGRKYPPVSAVREIVTTDQDEKFADCIQPLRRIDCIRPYRYGLWSLAVAHELLNMKSEADAVEFVDSQAEGFVSLTSQQVRSRWAGVPMYLRAHAPMHLIETLSGMDANRFGRHIYHSWEKASVVAADGVVAPSAMMRKVVSGSGSTTVIPHPYKLERNRPASPRQPTIILAGNIEPNKGVEVWARSLNTVFAQTESIQAILVGSDTPTAPTGGSLAKYVAALIEPTWRKRFQYCDNVSHSQLERAVSQASLVVVPSRFESFSYVAAEAIAHGCPVIASDRVGLVEHVPSLLRVPVDDVEALAEAQIRMLQHTSDSQQYASTCLEELKSACSPSQFANNLASYIQSLAPKDRGRHAATDSMELMDSFLTATFERAEAGNLSSVRS